MQHNLPFTGIGGLEELGIVVHGLAEVFRESLNHRFLVQKKAHNNEAGVIAQFFDDELLAVVIRKDEDEMMANERKKRKKRKKEERQRGSDLRPLKTSSK